MIHNLKYDQVTISYATESFGGYPVTTVAKYFGAIAGIVLPGGMIENVGSVSGYGSNINLNIDSENTIYSGVITGVNYGEIKNCYIWGGSMFIWADTDTKFVVGTFVGQNSGTIKGCVALSTAVMAEHYVLAEVVLGTFVGENTTEGVISNSFSSSNVQLRINMSLSDSYTAGLYVLGKFAGINDGTFNNCIADGEVFAQTTNSGLMDDSTGNDLGINYTYNDVLETDVMYFYTINGVGWQDEIDDETSAEMLGGEAYAELRAMFDITLIGSGNGTAVDSGNADDNMMYTLYTLVGLDNSVWNVTSNILYGSVYYSIDLD